MRVLASRTQVIARESVRSNLSEQFTVNRQGSLLGPLQISYTLSADLIAEILPLTCQMCDLPLV